MYFSYHSLWDIGKAGCSLGVMKLPQNVEGSPLAAYDSTGLVFGVTATMAGDEGHVSSKMSALLLSSLPILVTHPRIVDISYSAHSTI